MGSRIQVKVGGPYFEDLEPGQVFDAPALTITDGHAALHQSIAGDCLALALDRELSRQVCGAEAALVHPNLVCDVAIGQSTPPSQRVLGNLFYRGLVLERPVFCGDTLSTRTEVIAMKQNRRRADAAGSGLAALRVTTRNQRGEGVLDYVRCPMIPMRDGEADTGHADRFDQIPSELDPARVRAAVPGWGWELLRARLGEPPAPEPGTVLEVEARDTVSCAPELARLTLNVAMTHRDPGAGAHGRRLVYGGQTISIAAAQASRALPGLATIVAWRSCDHLAPVFEGDVLAAEVTVAAVEELDAGVRLADLRVGVNADRGAGKPLEQVLDWAFVGVLV